MAAADIMSRNRHAYREMLTLCLTTGSRFGFGQSFIDRLGKLLQFVTFASDPDELRGRLGGAFEKISARYNREMAEGADPGKVVRDVLSGLCEELTYALLCREGDREQVVRDVFAFDGPNRIPRRNTANLDFAAESIINRDGYWEVFECKQNPSGFFEPSAWENDPDPNRSLSWRRSQVRLALAILDCAKKFVSVCVVCYWPAAHVERNMRRLEQIPPGIGIYDQAKAWDHLPWCQLPTD